jgi:hypothetical protein
MQCNLSANKIEIEVNQSAAIAAEVLIAEKVF